MQFAEIINDDKYKRLNIILDPINLPYDGFVFLYPSWSLSYYYIVGLLDVLNELQYSKAIYILDIDKNAYKLFSEKYNFISHGYGELFYLKDEVILGTLIIKKIELDLMYEKYKLIDDFVKGSLLK